MLTSKGQMTIPVAFRKKLGIKTGERVLVEMQGDKVIIQKNNWREGLRRIQSENLAHMKKHGIKPLSDEELDNAINSAAEQASIKRLKRSQ
jgi:AbrB family looped-hinge helix DNA binding protein